MSRIMLMVQPTPADRPKYAGSAGHTDLKRGVMLLYTQRQADLRKAAHCWWVIECASAEDARLVIQRWTWPGGRLAEGVYLGEWRAVNPAGTREKLRWARIILTKAMVSE